MILYLPNGPLATYEVSGLWIIEVGLLEVDLSHQMSIYLLNMNGVNSLQTFPVASPHMKY